MNKKLPNDNTIISIIRGGVFLPKKVAVQEGLNDIKGNLERLGYDVYTLQENNSVDAIVYMADGYDISYYNTITNMNQGVNMDENKGAILINAKGKSIDEIEYIIENRVYSRIFE